MESELPRFVALILGIEGLAFTAIVIVVIYLIVRRINIRKNEDFEKRDN